MEKELLQQENDSMSNKVRRNDEQIRNLVNELKKNDERFSEFVPDQEIEERKVEEEDVDEIVKIQEGPDKKAMLDKFFANSVETLCEGAMKALGLIDPEHSDDYQQFHQVFVDFEGKKKELRFFMSKIGNLVSVSEKEIGLAPIGLTDIEGADEEFTQKHLINPQHKAIYDFAEPIADDEFPELIATHFFQ